MKTRNLVIPAILIAALTAAGCASLGGDSDSGSSATRSSDGGRSGATVSDSDIVSAIKGAFQQDPQLAAANISVNAEQGMVTLSGNVPSALVYNRAISVARNVPGVRPPVNAARLKF